MIWFGWVLWHINHCRLFNAKSSLYICIKYMWFGLVGFYSISTTVGYLMPNPLYTYYIWFVIPFELHSYWRMIRCPVNSFSVFNIIVNLVFVKVIDFLGGHVLLLIGKILQFKDWNLHQFGHTHTYTHTHSYTHTYIFMLTQTHAYIHAHTHRDKLIHTYTHRYTCIHTHTHIYRHTFIHIDTHTHTIIYTHTHTHIDRHIHIRTYIHTYIHIQTYIYIQLHIET